jgi:hypothetical protein
MLCEFGKEIDVWFSLKPLAVGSKLSGCDWLGPLNKDLDSWFACVCKQAGW